MRRCNPMVEFYSIVWGMDFPICFSILRYRQRKHMQRRRYERRAYRQYIDHLLPF